jgi:putative tricarboxylic transport membrane protein
MPVLLPVVLVLSMIGAYAVEGQAVLAATWDMGVALVLGIIGYYLRQADYPTAPIVLGLILGGMLEVNFRRAVKLARGNYLVFFTKPIAAVFLALAVFAVVLPLLRRGKRR